MPDDFEVPKRWPRELIIPIAKPTFFSKDVEWQEGWTLYIKKADLARRIYNAMFSTLQFRIVVDGAVVLSIPKDKPGSHQATDKIIWSSSDMDWDDAGCLVIKSSKIGDHVKTALANGDFNIVMDESAIAEESTSGDPGGEGKLNAMCPC